MSTSAGSPVTKALLAWMQAGTPRLRALLEQEAKGIEPGGDLSPAGGAAIRAHLRLVAEALADLASPGREERARAFAASLPELFVANADDLEEAVGRGREALGFELALQLGESAREDPANRAMLERRARVLALFGFFLRARDDALAPDPPTAAAAERWMRDNQSLLSVLNARTGRALASGGGEADTARVAQAAMLQAHVRFLVEAIGATAGARAG